MPQNWRERFRNSLGLGQIMSEESLRQLEAFIEEVLREERGRLLDQTEKEILEQDVTCEFPHGAECVVRCVSPVIAKLKHSSGVNASSFTAPDA